MIASTLEQLTDAIGSSELPRFCDDDVTLLRPMISISNNQMNFIDAAATTRLDGCPYDDDDDNNISPVALIDDDSSFQGYFYSFYNSNL